KRKREAGKASNELDTSRPTAIFKPTEARAYTVSVAVPGSVITNAQSPELKTQLAGRIARALGVFCVDEVIVFDDSQTKRSNAQSNGRNGDTFTGNTDPNHFLLHILSYLETPPYLRTSLFPMHPDFQYAGVLPSLDLPHHLRRDDWCQYREGITVETPPSENGDIAVAVEHGKKRKKRESVAGASETKTFVNVGLANLVSVPSAIPAQTRVTLRFPEGVTSDYKHQIMGAEAVAPSEPREKTGYYWGYNVRPASSLSTVLTESPFEGGYDVTFGTSERGIPLSTLQDSSSTLEPVPEFRHMLIIFGGVAGLEPAVQADEELQKMGVTEPSMLFDYWVNLCPGQGSRTIRTEEAVWLGLMGLRNIILSKGTKNG
ncbi:MAG: hypothetical protein Q9195_002706, partial [Heterodermia aff. obscurata]